MDSVSKEELIELAKHSDGIKSLDWGMIPIEEETVYDTLASAVLMSYGQISHEYRDIVLITALLALNVQNFVLMQQKLELISTIERLKAKN